MNTKMNQPLTRMGNKRRDGARNEKMDVVVQIRGTPSQIRELFQGSSTAAIQQGTTAYSISGSTFSGSGISSSGVQLAEIESGQAQDEEIRNAKLCCGGCCCLIFSPLANSSSLICGVNLLLLGH